jgi:hypothetical protein
LWLIFCSSKLIRYHAHVLPDIRENNLAYAVGTFYGCVINTDDGRLFLSDYKSSGLSVWYTYEVHYLPRAKLAVSASLLKRMEESQITALSAKQAGFTESDLEANRNGRLSFKQRILFLQRNWLILPVLVLIVLNLWSFLSLPFMGGNPANLEFYRSMWGWTCGFAILMGLIFVVVQGFSDNRKKFSALFERKVLQTEGVLYAYTFDSVSTDSEDRKTITAVYRARISDTQLEVTQNVYEVLPNEIFCRVYFTARTKYLLSWEALRI